MITVALIVSFIKLFLANKVLQYYSALTEQHPTI